MIDAAPGARPRTILVIGGTGFLGGRLAAHLRGSGSRVRLGTRDLARVGADDPDRIHVDYEDAATLERACAGADAVVHLAGPNAATCARNPAAGFAAHARGTRAVVRAAVAAGVPRLLRVSTMHVYGAPLRGRIDETTPPSPAHPYASAHLDAERELLAGCDGSATVGVVARLSNAFGAPAHPAVDCWTLVVPDACRQAVTTGRIVLRSAGLQRRDFVTVGDACRAFEHLLGIAPAEAGIFHVGGRWTPTVREVAERVAATVGRRVGVVPELVAAEPRADERTEPLDYRIDRLAATGFVLRADVDAELEATVDACARWFGATAAAARACGTPRV